MSMTQDDLLSTLRNLPPEQDPDGLQRICEQLVVLNNHLDDIKRKLDISNEIKLEFFGEAKGWERSNPAVQARPIKNVPTPRPIRKWNEKTRY